MKLRHWVVLALVLLGGYVAFHWLVSHGGAASVSGKVGSFTSGANVGIG